MTSNRRQFLLSASVLGVAGSSLGIPVLAADPKKDEEEISAPEDLMREHGVLNRILLIYEEGLRRLRARQEITPEVFHRTATLVRKFVEDYHEKLEENFIFPEFEKRKKQTELVAVLRKQHAAGRAVTDVILRCATAEQFRMVESRADLVRSCQAFIRMYRPHEAWEDTVLFPALYKIIPAKEVKELGEKFEKEEEKVLGKEGFEKTVDQVAALEKQLGIHDLAQFTPKISKP